jgi:coenzyme Q-binding protein COQ10
MPTHAEQRTLPFTQQQLFDLVSDVERYPEFLPWCIAVRMKKREETMLEADLVIGFKMFRESFTSRVDLDRPQRIDVTYLSGPLKYLNNHWRFFPVEEGCIIDFYVNFEFRSRVFQSLVGALFNEAVSRMVRAFEVRAHELYGAGSKTPGKA